MGRLPDIPYNTALGIEPADEPGFVLALDGGERHRNHLGTIHAAAQFSLAEATSAAVLIATLGGELPDPFAVVRRFDGRFRAPLRGRVRSRGSIDVEELVTIRRNLARKGRTAATVRVEIVDASGAVGLATSIEWFVSLEPRPAPEEPSS